MARKVIILGSITNCPVFREFSALYSRTVQGISILAARVMVATKHRFTCLQQRLSFCKSQGDRLVNFKEKYGPWAIVTGAARGIGKAYARELASRGLNVLLVDLLEEELNQTSEEIRLEFPIQCHCIRADLADFRQRQEVIKQSEQYSIGLFCCNHAMTKLFADGKLRAWIDTPIDNLQKMIQVNLESSVALIHHFANKMAVQQRGGILILSSMGAISGAPYVTQYGATKAFLANLGEALFWELKCKGVDITTVLPGLTRTNDVEKGLTEYGRKTLSMMEPSEVARISLQALGKQCSVIPGKGNQLQHFFLSRLAPRSMSISFFGKIFPKCFRVIPIKNSE